MDNNMYINIKMVKGDLNFGFKIEPICSTNDNKINEYFNYKRLHVTIMSTFAKYSNILDNYIDIIKLQTPIIFKLKCISDRNNRIIILDCLNEKINILSSELRSSFLRGAHTYEMNKQCFMPSNNNFHIIFPKNTDTTYIMDNVKYLKVTGIFLKSSSHKKMLIFSALE